MPEADIDTIIENHWENYLKECDETGTAPDISSFQVYLQDQDVDYEYED